jgi:hypothetical protein
MVVITVISTPAIVTPSTPVRTFYAFFPTGNVRVIPAAAMLAGQFANEASVQASNPPGTPSISIAPTSGNTIEVNSYVLAFDTREYRDFLRGGIRVDCGEPGTLGCIGTTKSGLVVALTNEHIVSSPAPTRPSHFAMCDKKAQTLTLGKFNLNQIPVGDRSLVMFALLGTAIPSKFAFYSAESTETAAAVAKGIADAINDSPMPGVNAVQNKSPKDDVVTITGAQDSRLEWKCDVYGPYPTTPTVKVRASITAPSPFTKVIEFAGEVPGDEDEEGIFIQIGARGNFATAGVFVDPNGLSLTEIAKKAASAINSLPAGVGGAVTAGAKGPSVSITGVQEVGCYISPDIRVGHPSTSFVWPCSHQIGRVLDSRLHVDAAIIPLDPGTKYRPVIEEIGVVDGTLPAGLLNVGLAVQKRGFASGLTTGTVIAVATSGFSVKQGQFFSIFKRSYDNAIVVESTTIEDVANGTLRPFIVSGDSGSALVTTGTGPVQVVGLLFAGDEGTTALATPIGKITDAFDQYKLSFALLPGQDPSVVRVVPETSVAFQALPENEVPESTEMDVAPAGRRWAGLSGWLGEVERGFAAMSIGREYANAFRSHFEEAKTLINTNRRVGTVWRRSGGPEIMGSLVEPTSDHSQLLPAEFNGKPLADCLKRIQLIMMKYATPSFSEDLKRYAPLMATWPGKTFMELLCALQEPFAK